MILKTAQSLQSINILIFKLNEYITFAYKTWWSSKMNTQLEALKSFKYQGRIPIFLLELMKVDTIKCVLTTLMILKTAQSDIKHECYTRALRTYGRGTVPFQDLVEAYLQHCSHKSILFIPFHFNSELDMYGNTFLLRFSSVLFVLQPHSANRFLGFSAARNSSYLSKKSWALTASKMFQKV